ncbi:tannase and feruloyl esterase [Microdochium trichocladiopsis]|uniref:Carboxylic ester hydrolase n=1 Tax=Microdochium trichocladiopsis TaxID=1682393 RepID=A0A9P8Y1N7_9PEZI|nr:tannase and feruloyl esterase [Microdochium trichocladiopsis]KAH7028799.1 tannase and feruloyl esterase [Microdochium trichocladiopsis]
MRWRPDWTQLLLSSLVVWPHGAATSACGCTLRAIDAAFSPDDGATAVFAISLGANSTFGQASDVAYPQNATYLPASCAVLVNVTSSPTSSYTFGVFLPQDWNQRTLTVGNGGFMGGINWLAMGDGLKYGFAAMSTDTGHNSTGIDMAWALNQPEAKADWAYRALHGSVVLTKKLVAAYYRSDNRYNYYSGCSTGGRQGIKSAQDFPDDFDGVLAGSPAWWSTHQQLWQLKVGAVNLPETSPAYIPPSQFSWLSDAVLAQCDGADGLVDNIIQDPDMCRLQIGKLICNPHSNRNASECLSLDQAETLRQLYSPLVEADAAANNITALYPNFGIGSEMQMPASFGANNTPSRYGTGYAKYYIYDDPAWDWEVSFNYSAWVLADRLNPGNVNAVNFDMTPFQARGGKLLTYHGWADGLIPSGASPLLYDKVQSAMASSSASSVTNSSTGGGGEVVDMDSWYCLFMVPGMQHCGGSVYDAPWYFGGSGQPASIEGTAAELGKLPVAGVDDTHHDALLALMAWVEQDTPVEYLVATKWANDTVAGGVRHWPPWCFLATSTAFSLLVCPFGYFKTDSNRREGTTAPGGAAAVVIV